MTQEQIREKVKSMPRFERIGRAVKVLNDERLGSVNNRISHLLDVGLDMNEVTEALNVATDGAVVESALGGVA